MRIVNNKNRSIAIFIICEPTVPQLEHLFKSIFHTYERLKELGFTYYNGKVTIINMEIDKNE